MASVLVVDGSAATRRELTLLLKDCGYEVVVGIDPEDGLFKAVRGTVDIVLADARLPDTAIALIRSLRAFPQYQDTPILLLGTDPDRELRAAASAAGATGWLSKPLNRDEVVTTLQSVLEGLGA
jgi:two-component system, chemotaxis family, chemotaxis protein CheY